MHATLTAKRTAAPRRARRRPSRCSSFATSTVSYGDHRAVADVTLDIHRNNDHRPDRPLGLREEHADPLPQPDERPDPDGLGDGAIHYHGQDLYGPKVDPVEVRKRIGMVFQKPNPFPKSIFENIAFGPGSSAWTDIDDSGRARAAPRGALGRGQGPARHQRLRHVGRPAAAALHRAGHRRRPRRDPDGRALLGARSDLNGQDRRPDGRAQAHYSIVIVTHNMQQAARVSDRTAFLIVELDAGEKHRTGRIVEFDDTEKIFTNPADPDRGLRLGQGGLRWRSRPGSSSSAELASLESQALATFDLAVEALERAIEACENQDMELASQVVANDDRIDGRYLDIHQSLLNLVALQAPVATDLRVVSALLHVIKCIERIGDQA